MGNFTAAQAETGVNVSYFATMCDKLPHVEGEPVRGLRQGKNAGRWVGHGHFGDLCMLWAIVRTRIGFFRHSCMQEGVPDNCSGPGGMLRAG